MCVLTHMEKGSGKLPLGGNFPIPNQVVDDRSIGLPMLRPMEPSVISKPSADGFHLKNIDFLKKWQKETSFENFFEKIKTVHIRKIMFH